eukprot:Nitzschia sp. Nitz4//scaffold22_size323478//247071//248783//NITZ4_000571-RA/size323478-processed-gene-0.114-mRNA-1//-1//CDS//3329543127//5106//frame0
MESPKQLRELLRQEGIQSNYVGDRVWTGVSLARWKELVNLLGTSQRDALPVAPAVWLSALWELARSKRDLLDFLLALDMYIQQVLPGLASIFDDTNEMACSLVHDEGSRVEWSNSSFHPSELDPAEAMNDLLAFPDWSSYEASRCLERVCASRANQHVGQPAVPNGRYAFDGGEVKPDCVEVIVRELFNLLLWDELQGKFDVNRLPPNVCQQLIQLYHPQCGNEADPKPIGQAWYDMLSNLNGADYLAMSPNGLPYELTPTLANVSRVVQILLGLSSTSPKWRTLEEMAEAWNEVSRGAPPLRVSTRKTSHRGAISNDMQHHVLATLHLEGAQNGIELKLDRTHEHATVTHVRRRSNQIGTDKLEQLLLNTREGTEPFWTLVSLATMGDYGVMSRDDTEADESDNTESIVLLEMLAAHYGADRRNLMVLTSTSDLDVESNFHNQALRESRHILARSIATACSTELSPSVRRRLLTWFLDESPEVVPEHESLSLRHDSHIERALLSLPVDELYGLPLLGNTWACRGNDLHHAVSFLQQKSSFPTFLVGENLTGICSRLRLFILLLRKNHGL